MAEVDVFIILRKQTEHGDLLFLLHVELSIKFPATYVNITQIYRSLKKNAENSFNLNTQLYHGLTISTRSTLYWHRYDIWKPPWPQCHQYVTCPNFEVYTNLEHYFLLIDLFFNILKVTWSILNTNELTSQNIKGHIVPSIGTR